MFLPFRVLPAQISHYLYDVYVWHILYITHTHRWRGQGVPDGFLSAFPS